MAKKRANGDGSIVALPNNSGYRAFFTDPNGKRITKQSKDREIVKEWLISKQSEVIKDEYIAPSDQTFGDYMLYYLESHSKHTVRARTYERYTSLLEHLDPLSNTPIQELMPDHFRQLYPKISLSGSTIQKIHRLASQALKQACIDQIIHRNPLIGVSPPKATKKEIEIFTPEELQTIFASAENNPYKEAFQLISVTGLRLSELLGLRWSDFDPQTNQIHITQTLHLSLEKGLVFEEPKTKASNRKISISAKMSQALTKIKKAHPVLIFANTQGRPLRQDVLITAWKKLLKAAEIPYRGLHTLRHTHATMLLKEGTPITEVSRRLGHSRVSTTLDVYSHAIPADDHTIVSTVDRLYKIF